MLNIDGKVTLGLAVLSLAASMLTAMPAASAAAVVASITPVHALVSRVMADVGVPRLLVQGGPSPHAYVLRPSDARALAEAKLVFWIGPELERFLEKPLTAIAADVRVVRLSTALGVQTLPTRKAGSWTDAKDDHGHEHDGIDPHLWLDPVNAARIVDAIAAALSKADPGNADRYRKNADQALGELRALELEIRDMLAPVTGVPYLVFHDAYQYFEKRFDLAAAGAIAVGANRPAGARRIAELRRYVIEQHAKCVFTEPQFQPALATTITADTQARIGVLDPLGAALAPGSGLYPELMRGLARSLRDCLQAAPQRG